MIAFHYGMWSAPYRWSIAVGQQLFDYGSYRGYYLRIGSCFVAMLVRRQFRI